MVLLWGITGPGAKAQVYDSPQKGYTVEVLGTYNLTVLTTAMDAGSWDAYRRVTLPVTLVFDEGTRVRLHPASSRPQPRLDLAVPDADPAAPRTFMINASGHLMLVAPSPVQK